MSENTVLEKALGIIEAELERLREENAELRRLADRGEAGWDKFNELQKNNPVEPFVDYEALARDVFERTRGSSNEFYGENFVEKAVESGLCRETAKAVLERLFERLWDKKTGGRAGYYGEKRKR